MKNWLTYIIQREDGGPVKIGKAVRLMNRISELQTSVPSKLVLVYLSIGDKEKELHQKFKSHRIRGEWFSWSDEVREFCLRNRHASEAALGICEAAYLITGDKY